jgi:3-oxoacyl-[acyl-carrier protein] reductase
MSDRYQQLVNTPIGKIVSKQIGLPSPITLERYERGQPVISGPVLFGAGGAGSNSRLAGAVANVLAAIDADVHTPLTNTSGPRPPTRASTRRSSTLTRRPRTRPSRR